ncbi:hypothetical protein GQ457_03G020880 [Hibiscus cannabinus]
MEQNKYDPLITPENKDFILFFQLLTSTHHPLAPSSPLSQLHKSHKVPHLSLITGKMPNSTSGMAVNDECKMKFLELKAKRNYNLQKLGEPKDNYEKLCASLPPNECCNPLDSA